MIRVKSVEDTCLSMWDSQNIVVSLHRLWHSWRLMSPGDLLLCQCLFLSASSARQKTWPAAPQAPVFILYFCHKDKKKKAADLSCILYIMSSFSECQWLKVLDRLFWFLSHCVRAAQSWSITAVSCVWKLQHSHWLFLAAVLSWGGNHTWQRAS